MREGMFIPATALLAAALFADGVATGDPLQWNSLGMQAAQAEVESSYIVMLVRQTCGERKCGASA